ncbi:GlxA family transcriptional regulator [Actinoalloteichus hymeniacidonis]|uniref:AraC family transcriptional regulator n=1 Tax=Actinoalloteichus hymeniacidonis TaxID=340345 RepID=A0AAC9HMK6_9PSEU|nr:helix-turn-helix domain-containing protein [Actinoalloteichus hymeniacidonis]AOS62074.1 AraC family transcriptional regulator [Actinoalloteichus hymeniacidonis]MBB5909904.1 transcriptional regulator GlxA family with amidase domain [Actinoalloteichus hymeniacidonis]
MHTVVVLAMDGVVPFDLSVPVEVFGRARLPDGRPAYRVRVCAETDEVPSGAFTLRVPWGLDALAEADTVILPGQDPVGELSDVVRQRLIDAAAKGTRIASICAGAFALAETGLLDGLRATTHWVATTELARRHPAILVDPNVLFVDNGQILTSAGAAAGLDMCLHLVRRDHGSAVAADAARQAVMPLERAGGQAQFIVREEPAPEGASLEPLLRWMTENAGTELSIDDIACHAAMSTRTLNRRFREQTGTTPLQWLHRVRLRQAQYLLETTDYSVERVAGQVGFGSTTTFRDRFKRLIGTSPNAYRRAFRTTEESP